MIAYTALSDFLLYLVMAFLTGAIALEFVPDGRKPEIRVTGRQKLIAAAFIPVLAAAPVIQLAMMLAPAGERLSAFLDIAARFRAGHSFLAVVILAVLLIAAIGFRANAAMQAVLMALAFIAIAYGSHSASTHGQPGLAGHAVHLAVLSVWAGILLIIAWRPSETMNWRAFIRWFTPFSVVLMAIIIGTGIFLMLFVVRADDYASSWMLPYGQMLLLKHLSILPLLAAALVNGFLLRSERPVMHWLKTESLLLGFVLLFTAFMSKLAPPHDVNSTFAREGAAPLAEWLSGPAGSSIRARLDPNPEGLLILVIATLLLLLLLIGGRRELPKWLVAAAGIGFIAAAYAGLMMVTAF
ncbi:copper resistance D family protein [Bhargavaea ginsengi]|uniref:copper resistance D family protein n=1 Tax=Bhargavaea ginsengi TaxID=426757 RepID=UPI003C710480